MLKKILVFLTVSLLSLSINAETIDLINDNHINIGNITAGEEIQIDLTIDLNIECNVNAELIKNSSRYGFSEIMISQTNFIDGNLTIELNYKQLQNISFSDFIEFEVTCNDLKLNIPFVITGNANFSNDYYNETFDLYGSKLQSKLSDIISRNYVERTYKAARELFWSSFDNREGFVECVYTGSKVETDGIPDVNATRFNTEHTWPRAYGSDKEPQLSDMFHIYPTTEESNSKRANYPFGYVEKSVTWQFGGSKLGTNSNGKLVFEARDAHKGNVGRSIFYFATKWGNRDNFLNDEHEDVLREWMLIDPVDEWEARRNDSIFAYQGNRNPYIDYPEFLFRLDDFDGDNSQKPDSVFNSNYYFSLTILGNDVLNFPFWLINPNQKELTIKSIEIDNNSIIVNETINTINALSAAKFVFTASITENSKNKIIISFNEISETVTLNFDIIEKVMSVSDYTMMSVVEVFPNPANDNIKIQIPYDCFNVNGNLSIDVFNLQGRKVFTNANETISGNDVIFDIDVNKFKIYGNTFYFVIKNNEKIVNNGSFIIKK